MNTLILSLDRPISHAVLSQSMAPPSTACGLNQESESEQVTADSLNDGTTELLTKIEDTIQQHTSKQACQLKELSSRTVEMAMQIASCIVGQSIESSSERLEQLLRDAMQRFETENASKITLRLNPSDAERLAKTIADLTTDFDCESQVIADNSIAIGDCQIATTEHSIEANLQRHLEEIERQLMERFAHE